MDNLLANQVIQQPQNQPTPPQEAYNPFNTGIQRAIQSARQSLAMTKEQEEAALRNSMLAFGSHIGQEPVQKGFWNNFGAAARALAPAVSTYDQSEQQAEAQNQALAEKLLAYRQHEEAKLAQEEERKWRKKMAEDQFNESKRQHDLLRAFKKDQLEEQRSYHTLMSEAKKNKGDGKYLNRTDLDEKGRVQGKYLPFKNDKEYNKYSDLYRDGSDLVLSIKGLENNINKFEEKYQNKLISPFAPLGIGDKINSFQTNYAHFANDPQLIADTKDRADLVTQIGNFIAEFDRLKRGGGILTPSMMEALRKIGAVPDEHDPPHILKSKLQGILKVVSPKLQRVEKSLELNAHVNDEDEAEKQQNTPQAASEQQGERVILKDKESGKAYSVTPERAKILLDEHPDKVELVE